MNQDADRAPGLGPGGDSVQALLAKAPSVEVGAVDPEGAQRALAALGLTDSSPLGAVVGQTGGLVVDAGWLRILGSGSDLVGRSIEHWNRIHDNAGPRCDRGLLVGDDAIGGFFVLGGEPQDTEAGILYLAPDSLDYEDLGVDYGTWLAWCLGAGPARFYGEERWEGWRQDTTALGTGEAWRFQPPLVAEGPDVGDRPRTAVGIDALWDWTLRAQEALRDLAEGERFTLDLDS